MNIKIKGKILILIAVVVLISLGLDTMFNIIQFQETYPQALQAKVVVVGEILLEEIQNSFSLGFELNGLIGVNERCQKIVGKYDEIEYCYITDSKNKVLYHNNLSYISYSLEGESNLEKQLSENVKIESTVFEGDPVYDIILGINNQGNNVGQLRLGLPVEMIEIEKRKMIGKSVLVMFISFILAILISFYFSNTIVHPLNQLSKGSEEIAKGNLDYQLNISRKDEIGQLASSFNKMAVDLKKSGAKLKDYNKNLEKEVQERTKELEEKNQELEKFNRLIVGRELKMVELKEMIKELKEKIQKSK